MRVTVEQALRQFRRLHTADAGRLRGISLRSRWHQPIPTGDLPAHWADPLREAVTARAHGTITGTTPEYVVISGGTPVAWLTVHATVITPPVGATGVLAKHQRQAVEALSNLHRWVLRELADARDIRENGGRNAAREHEGRIGAIRVAPFDDPTNTTWVNVGDDYHATAAHAGRVVAALGKLPLRIISARGYGAYGQHAAHIDLRVLCAMHTITHAHPEAGLVTIGNWVAADPATTGRPADDPPPYEAVPADQLPAAFTAAYLGRYRSRRDYLQHRLRDNGWEHGLAALGIDPDCLDLNRLEHNLFTRQVYAVDAAPPGGIAVFTRHPAGSPVADEGGSHR